jgi:hypothetical protein
MTIRSTLLSLCAVALFAGCSPLSSAMVKAGPNDAPKPAANEAVVYFMRPSIHGAGVRAAVFRFDGNTEQLLGSLGTSDKMVSIVPAGNQTFMVTDPYGAHGGFMKAELEAGRTYHVVVTPAGWPLIFFELHPVKSDPSSDFPAQRENVKRWMADPSANTLGPGAAEATKAIGAQASEFRKQRYEGWLNSPEGQSEKNMLKPTDGK